MPFTSIRLFLVMLFMTTSTPVLAADANGTLLHPYKAENCTSRVSEGKMIAASGSSIKDAGEFKKLCPDGVYVFDDDDDDLQAVLNAIYASLSGDPLQPAAYSLDAEWSSRRFALLFMPGEYDVEVKVNYYTQVLGLSQDKSQVKIDNLMVDNMCDTQKTGSCITLGALNNFWRGVENIHFTPKTCRIGKDPANGYNNDKCIIWNVSQAAPMRNVSVDGDLMLNLAGCFDYQGQCLGPKGTPADRLCVGIEPGDDTCGAGFASGGFLAQSSVDGDIHSIGQQQWFTRNSNFINWVDGVWNIVVMNSQGNVPASSASRDNANLSSGQWSNYPYTKITDPLNIQEKPYLVYIDKAYHVVIPGDKTYALSNIAVMNRNNQSAVIGEKAGLLIEPGVYDISTPIEVPEGKFVLGVGVPELRCIAGNSCLNVSGNNAIVAGVMLAAGYKNSEALLKVTGSPSSSSMATTLTDIFCRIGESNPERQGNGPTADNCIVIDADYVMGDNLWLWRGDHDRANNTYTTPKLVQWGQNPSKHGLLVNGDNVTMLGLFSEHFMASNVLWKGDHGKTYFYQSELAYNAPSDWQCEDFESAEQQGGCPSYHVSKDVTAHNAYGLGVYTFFQNNTVIPAGTLAPLKAEILLQHMVGRYLNGGGEIESDSGMKHLVCNNEKSINQEDNCSGASAGKGEGDNNEKARTPAMQQYPAVDAKK